jgi:hypothetical protein
LKYSKTALKNVYGSSVLIDVAQILSNYIEDPVEEIWEFDVLQVNNKNAIWIDKIDPSDPYFYRLEKL